MSDDEARGRVIPTLKTIASVEYRLLFFLIRLFAGKKKRKILKQHGRLKVDQLMALHCLNRNLGYIRRLNVDECCVSKNGLVLIVPCDDADLVDEVKTVYQKPKENDVVIDVGAHYGFFSLMASRCVGPTGLILAFEPCGNSYRRLLANIKLNNIENVAAFNFALASFDGQGKLYHGSHSGAHSFVFEGTGICEIVETRKLDTIVNDLGLATINLIKIDVEGAELEVLQGAHKTLKCYKPKLSIAAYHFPEELNEIRSWMKRNTPFYQIEIIKHATREPYNIFLHSFART